MNKQVWQIHSILAHPGPSTLSFLRSSSLFFLNVSACRYLKATAYFLHQNSAIPIFFIAYLTFYANMHTFSIF